MSAYEAGVALCAPFLEQLPVTGASITVVSRSGAHSTVGTSDLIAVRLEELQFQLGEGPTADATRTGRSVLVPDLGDADVLRGWPVFAPAAQDIGARALFSFPMTLGVDTVGAVSLYSLACRPPWSVQTLQTAVTLTGATAPPAVQLATRSALAEPEPGRQQVELRREVHQAAGMLMVQLDSSIDEAMARLRAHAFVQDRPIDSVAREVISGVLRFTDSDD